MPSCYLQATPLNTYLSTAWCRDKYECYLAHNDSDNTSILPPKRTTAVQASIQFQTHLAADARHSRKILKT